MKSFYKDFNFGDVKDKKELNKQELYLLYKKPEREKKENMGNYNSVYSANFRHQADLLHMPDDEGYKYMLVVVDIATRLCDAEPLKDKESKTVAKAFETIYEREIIEKPEWITVDDGTEFKGEVLKYFKNNKIGYKVGKPGRHRQLAVAERTNQYLAKGLFMRMQAQELLTGQTSREWVEDLPKFVKYVNKKRGREPPQPKDTDETPCVGKDCDLLDFGTKVRVKLDHPKDYVSDKKLHGKFRITDIRWDPEVRTIKNVLLVPDQVPMYLLNDIKNPDKIDNSAAYTRLQLQIVPENEVYPPPSVIRGTPETYIVQKILDKRKVKNRTEFLVLWKGYPESQATWEPRTKLIKDVPKLINDYENN